MSESLDVWLARVEERQVAQSAQLTILSAQLAAVPRAEVVAALASRIEQMERQLAAAALEARRNWLAIILAVLAAAVSIGVAILT